MSEGCPERPRTISKFSTKLLEIQPIPCNTKVTSMDPLRFRRASPLAALVVAVLATTLSACVGGAAAPGCSSSDSLTLHHVGYSVPKEANKAIQAKFAQTPEGKGVVWEESYGAS